jgi:hypothetical protein
MPFLLFVALAVCAEVTGQTFTAHQSLSAATTFRGCTFHGCQTRDAGGALLCMSRYSLSLLECTFADCKAADGGAICAIWPPTFTMTATTGRNCSAIYDMYCMASASGALEVRDSSVTACFGETNALILTGGSRAAGKPTLVQSVNATDNAAFMFGSGLELEQMYNASVHFATFARGWPTNCLTFAMAIQNSDISCIAVVGCVCQSEEVVKGLIAVGSKITMETSVFQSNTFDFFIGVYTSGATGTSVSFVKCIFSKPNTATGKLSVVTSGCATIQTSLPVASGKCPWPAKLNEVGVAR